jgi:hypothetical protein
MKQQPGRTHPIELAIPAAVALLAVGLLVGGFVFHSYTVYYTETIQPDPVEIPEELRVDPWTGQPIEIPQPEPEVVERTAVEPEYRIVLEVTRGGVTFEDGEIRLLYTPGEAPPSLCPT